MHSGILRQSGDKGSKQFHAQPDNHIDEGGTKQSRKQQRRTLRCSKDQTMRHVRCEREPSVRRSQLIIPSSTGQRTFQAHVCAHDDLHTALFRVRSFCVGEMKARVAVPAAMWCGTVTTTAGLIIQDRKHTARERTFSRGTTADLVKFPKSLRAWGVG